MYKSEGFYGFFRGNFTNVIRISPLSAIELHFYAHYKKTVFSGTETTKLGKLGCGFLTALTVRTATTVTYPLDLIRTLLSVSFKNPYLNGHRPSIYKSGRQIYGTDGCKGLYRGLSATIFVSISL